ncbi:hypothetical protein M9Y10_045365 [Tritrichomonas musculus]|uniref:DnaK protein n=1 Tax=Tritrichomonas musculus TaxID=1915356 RepID=A0ABR2JV23_9EUKA
MLFSLFLYLSSCSIYALDIGSENLRLAISAAGKPIEIVTNDRGHRFTPNYLAYPIHNKSADLSEEQWIIGSEAERIYYRNRTHAIRNPFKSLWTPNNTEFAGLPPIVSVSTLLYSNLFMLQPRVDKVTLAVPLYTSPQVRYSLHQSLKLLGYRSVNVLDSCTAIASLYAVERVRKGQKKGGLSILFVDIGSENIDCSLFKFKTNGKQSTSFELLQYRHSSHVGGKFVDDRLLQFASEQVGKEFVGSEVFTVRNILRKAKERLAANKDIGIDLTEDYNKYLTLTQEHLQNLTSDMTKIIHDLLKDIEKPDEIELIGGSSRLKVFTDVLSEVFPDVQVRRSLNSDEAVAIGAAYHQALKSGSTVGANLDIKKPTAFGLNVTIEGKNQVVFEPGDIVAPTTVKMNANESRIISTSLDLEIYDEYIIDSDEFNTTSPNYTQVLIENVDNALNQLEDEIVKGTTPEISLVFGNSPDYDCPDLISATLLANITTTNPRLRKRGHGNTTITERKLFLVPSLLDKEFHVPSNARSFIRKLMKADEDRRNRQEACHKIESFIIDNREKALYDDDFKAVTTEEERKEMAEHLQEERAKVDCTVMINQTTEELEKQLQSLKDRYEKPIKRLDEFIHRPIQLQKLQAVIEKGEEAIPDHKCDDETLKKFVSYLNETRELIANLTSQSPLEQPNFTIKDMKDREKEILKKIPELKRPPKKSDVINFSTSDADDMDDEEYERLKNAGIMFNRPKKRKHFDIPENQDLKEDIDKERKYFKTFKDKQNNESRDFRDEKRNFQSANRDFYRFESFMRRNNTYKWVVSNCTKDVNDTVKELKANLTRMRQEGIERREKIQEERWANATLKNATGPDGKVDEVLHKQLIEKMREEDKKMKEEREEARKVRKAAEKLKRDGERNEEKRKEEKDRKRRRREEQEKKLREARRANMTEEELMWDEIGQPPDTLNEEERKVWLKKRVDEYKAKKFMLDNADSIDDDLKPLSDEDKRKYDELKRKFEGGGSKPFENDEDRKKYEEERRVYDSLKRRIRQSPTPKPSKTPKPSESPLPPEWEELADDLKSLTDDEERYYKDRIKYWKEKIEFKELMKVFPGWKAKEDEKKAREQAEREARQRRREEERQRRIKEDEARRKKAEEDRQRRMKEEEERRKRREEERERRRIEQENYKKQQELKRQQREQENTRRQAARNQQQNSRREQKATPPSVTPPPPPTPPPSTPKPEKNVNTKVEDEESEDEL